MYSAPNIQQSSETRFSDYPISRYRKIMIIHGFGLTDVGKKRHYNEDDFLCDVTAGLFIVADGMGGRAAGETASKAVTSILPMMLQTKLAALETPTPPDITALLKESLCHLSQELRQQSQEISAIRGLGSTAAVLLASGNIMYLAYAGDSRIYLLRDRQLTQLSKDQTTAAALAQSGHLDPKVVEQHPLNQSLEEYIGKEGDLQPGVWYKKFRAGDRWLLCSDGVTKGIPDPMLCDMLLQEVGPEKICCALIATAKHRDGSDNITAIVVDIVGV